eukprot:gene9672-1884_t
MSDELLTSLEQRVAQLEHELGSSPEVPLKDALHSAFQHMQKLVQEHEHIKQLWEQYAAIEKLVPPEGLDSFTTPDPIKAQILLADEERIKESGRQLEAVSHREKFVNSEAIQEAPSYNIRLKPLRAVHIRQMETVRNHQDRVSVLLQAYNNIVMMLSQQFVQWDALITQAERKRGLFAS